MSPLTLLVALLVVSYVGGFVSVEKRPRPVGWPSGVEFVFLGLVIGPYFLAFVSGESVMDFKPLLLMALGWLLTLQGAKHGVVIDRSTSWSNYLTASGFSLLSLTLAAGVHFVLGRQLLHLEGQKLLVLCLGSAAVGSGTSAQALRWFHRGDSCLSSKALRLAELGKSNDLLPLLVLVALSALAPRNPLHFMGPWPLALAALGLGALLGAAVAALLGSDLEHAELWPVLLGAVMLTVGIALRFHLPILPPAFFLGLSLSQLSPHRMKLRSLVARTERPMLHPVLLLTGALLTLPHSTSEALYIAAFALARVVLQLALSELYEFFLKRLGVSGPRLGLSLMPAGSASIAIGLSLYFAYPGEMGRIFLNSAVLINLVGDVLGTRAVKRLLSEAGELA